MAKKRMSHGTPTVITENGVTTTTSPFYLRELKEFTPLPNGVNGEAMDFIANLVADKPALWNQNTWREIFTDNRNNATPKMLAALEIAPWLDQPDGGGRCGTAMCIAGWAAEVTAADFVIDFSMAKAPSAYNWQTAVLIRRDDERFGELDGEGYYWPEELDIKAGLERRGFSNDTHRIITVSAYGATILGIGTDPLCLFNGQNKLVDVLTRMDVYKRFGTERCRELMRFSAYSPEPGALEEAAEFYLMLHGRNDIYMVSQWLTSAYLDRVTKQLADRGVGIDFRRKDLEDKAAASEKARTEAVERLREQRRAELDEVAADEDTLLADFEL